MRKWFRKQSIQTKLILAYTVLGLFPMLFIAAYTYVNTRALLLDGLYEDLSAQLAQTRKTLEEKMRDYYSVSNILYMDDTLYNYLTVDYSQRGYEELYGYVDGLCTNIHTLYPDISGISFYTSNDTLPKDGYYFNHLDWENLPDWYARTSWAGGTLHMEGEDGQTVSFTRLMNLYELGEYSFFIKIEVPRESLESILESGDDQVTLAVSGEDGKVKLTNRPELLGTFAAWEETEGRIVMQDFVEYCGTLTMYTDSRRFNAIAGRAASRILLVFCASLGLAFLSIYLYSRGFRRDVEKVMTGAKAIGDGQLDYQIPDPREDEIGQIARSVNRMGSYINTLVEDSYKKELARQTSELNLLQEQINPHFLYNALSSISSLALCNKDKDTNRALVCLSEFYRISLNKGKQELTIREEIRLLDSYLKIQQVRFGDVIRVEYELDETLLERKVVKLALQPVVENSIHHGRTDDSDVFHILIRLFEEEEKTIFEVIDDGCGIEQEKLLALQESMNQSEGGYGLKNVNIRIKLRYGMAYGLFVESEPGVGTKVRIELPGADKEGECNGRMP